MATALASRFAVLSVDVDDDYSKGKKKPLLQKPPESKPQATKSSKSETNLKKKNKLQSVQVQPPKPKKKSNNTSKKKKEPTEEQWEEWKQKDAQFVEGNYEEELSQAILLSKIDYEEKKDYYDAIKKAHEDNKKLNKKNKKTNKAMSLDEFHNSVGSSNSREDSPTVNNKKTDKIKEDPEMFERLKEEIKKEIKKEISKEELVEKKKPTDSFSQEALTLAQYEDALERRDREIAELKEEIVKLKEDLFSVKTRNKKLCHILANGEMKDKAEVLMEVERLEAVKDELSNEVSSLYAQLEQERSKVSALTGEQKSKDKNKKRTVSSSDTTQ